MTEPQVWTLIGVFAATLVGILTLASTLFLRVLRAETAALATSIDGLRLEMGARIDGWAGQMTARIDKVDRRLDHLDRDVQTLVRHIFPERP